MRAIGQPAVAAIEALATHVAFEQPQGRGSESVLEHVGACGLNQRDPDAAAPERRREVERAKFCVAGEGLATAWSWQIRGLRRRSRRQWCEVSEGRHAKGRSAWRGLQAAGRQDTRREEDPGRPPATNAREPARLRARRPGWRAGSPCLPYYRPLEAAKPSRAGGLCYFGGAGVKTSRLLGSGLGFGLGAFFVSFLPLSLFPMGDSVT